MRDAMLSVETSISERDASAYTAALKKCQALAKRYFLDDGVALASFTSQLKKIHQHVRTKQVDEGLQTAAHVRWQLQQLCMMSAPDEIVEEFAKLHDSMTGLDFYVGQLCEKTFVERGSPAETIFSGMLQILQFALADDFANGDDADSLLKEKSAASSADAAQIRHHMENVLSVLSQEVWSDVEERAQRDSVPRIVPLTVILLTMLDVEHPRPRGRVIRGYYALLAEAVFIFGLNLVSVAPSIAQELVVERCNFWPED